MTQTEPYPRTTELGHRMRPGTQPLGSPQLLHARAGVHVTNVIPAQRLSAGQDSRARLPSAGVRAGLIAEVAETTGARWGSASENSGRGLAAGGLFLASDIRLRGHWACSPRGYFLEYPTQIPNLLPERPTNKALFTVVNALLLRLLPFPIAAG